MSALVTIGLAMLAALLGGLALVFRRGELVTAQRLKRLARVTGPRLEATFLLEGAASPTPRRDALMLAWWPRGTGIESRLKQSGSTMSLGQYGTLVVVMAGAALVIGGLLAGIAAASVAALVAAFVPGRWLARRAAKRRRVFMDQFPDAIDLVVRALGAGLPLSAALGSVGDEFADPAGVEFRHVSAGLALGQSVEEALWEMVARVDYAENEQEGLSSSRTRRPSLQLSCFSRTPELAVIWAEPPEWKGCDDRSGGNCLWTISFSTIQIGSVSIRNWMSIARMRSGGMTSNASFHG